MTTSPGIPPPPLRLGDAGAAGRGLRASRRPAGETASPLARLGLDGTWLALSVTRAATGRSFRGSGSPSLVRPIARSSRQATPNPQACRLQVRRNFEGRAG